MLSLVIPLLVVAGAIGFALWAKMTGRQKRWEEEFRKHALQLRKTHPEIFPYRKRDALMTAAERDFYHVLRRAIPEAPIFPKVRVADVISAHTRYSAEFLKISQKHFDWVVCHPISFEPLVAIELDDSSHADPRQAKRDQDKNEAAASAGLPLIRFGWQPTYDENHVRNSIANIINKLD